MYRKKVIGSTTTSSIVAIDGMPENGCAIENAPSSWSGVMLQPKLVKGANLPGFEDKVLGNNKESGCASQYKFCFTYFASVGGAAEELYCNSLLGGSGQKCNT